MPRPKFEISLRLKIALVLLLILVSPVTALAEPTFTRDNFRQKWQRADKPVADATVNPRRSWLWGPEGFFVDKFSPEPYAESPGGNRDVEYFDKARMELNNPATGAVTNGLLVRELISGRLATGNTAYTQRLPALDIPVAGDPAGNEGPVYSSFARLATLNNDNPVENRVGLLVTDTLDKEGNIKANAFQGSQLKFLYYDQNLHHNIPDLFWTFMNQRGNIFVNGQLQDNQPVLGDNPVAPWLDAMGFPITEAYWSKVTLRGQVKDVLIQAFERRVLTYTPSNDPAFQVEMGNVGRHYYAWRYNEKYNLPDNKPAPPSCPALPENTGGAFPFIKCGPAGMEVVLGVPMTPNEMVTVTLTRPDNSTNSYTRTTRTDGNFLTAYETTTESLPGTWKAEFKGEVTGKLATAYFYLQPPVTSPTIIIFPNPSQTAQDITVAIIGFKPDEPVNLTFSPLAPGGDKYNLTRTTNGGGGFTFLIKLRDFIPPDKLAPGDWILLAQSQEDKTRQVSSTFTIVM